LLSIIFIVLDQFLVLVKSRVSGTKLSTNSFINRARTDYPLLNKQHQKLSSIFTQHELTSFSEWADNRIKTELKMTALVLAIIAASPRLSTLAQVLWEELSSIWETGKAKPDTFNIDFFPLSFESIGFILVIFAVGIQLLSFRWGKTHFYAQYTANRMKEAKSKT